MPTFDGGNDFVGICLPDEGARLLVVLFDEPVDDRLQVDDRVKDAVLQPSTCQFSKKPSTAFSHEHDVGTKWKIHRGCLASQAWTFGCWWVA